MRKIVALGLLGVLCFTGCGSQAAAPEPAKYVSPLISDFTPETSVVYDLLIGLNDKETGEQKLYTEQAKDMVKDVMAEEKLGYTIYVADGAYYSGDEMKVNETLILKDLTVSADKAKDLIDKLQKKLNVESIYCECHEVAVTYSGGNKPGENAKALDESNKEDSTDSEKSNTEETSVESNQEESTQN